MNRKRLDARGPLQAGPMLAHLEAHAIPGAELHDSEGQSHSRLIDTPGGPRAVTVHVAADGVELETTAEPGAELDAVEAGVRSWLDLDADTDAIRTALGSDQRIGPLIETRPGLRVVGYPDGFEGAIMTLLGQQVSLAAARTFGGRLVAAYGEPGPGGMSVFPSPRRIATVPTEELRAAIGITGARAGTVGLMAREFDDGLRLDPSVDRGEARERLLGIHGVGPWTVEYLAVRALKDPDAYPGGDLVLRRVLGGVSAREAAAMAEGWRPWRAYALFHLWTAGAFVRPSGDLGRSGDGEAED